MEFCSTLAYFNYLLFNPSQYAATATIARIAKNANSMVVLTLLVGSGVGVAGTGVGVAGTGVGVAGTGVGVGVAVAAGVGVGVNPA